MQIFKKTTTIDFLGARKYALILSSTLIVISLLSIVFRGLSLGIDFTGGTLVIRVPVDPSVEAPGARILAG